MAIAQCAEASRRASPPSHSPLGLEDGATSPGETLLDGRYRKGALNVPADQLTMSGAAG